MGSWKNALPKPRISDPFLKLYSAFGLDLLVFILGDNTVCFSHLRKEGYNSHQNSSRKRKNAWNINLLPYRHYLLGIITPSKLSSTQTARISNLWLQSQEWKWNQGQSSIQESKSLFGFSLTWDKSFHKKSFVRGRRGLHLFPERHGLWWTGTAPVQTRRTHSPFSKCQTAVVWQ